MFACSAVRRRLAHARFQDRDSDGCHRYLVHRGLPHRDGAEACRADRLQRPQRVHQGLLELPGRVHRHDVHRHPALGPDLRWEHGWGAEGFPRSPSASPAARHQERPVAQAGHRRDLRVHARHHDGVWDGSALLPRPRRVGHAALQGDVLLVHVPRREPRGHQGLVRSSRWGVAKRAFPLRQHRSSYHLHLHLIHRRQLAGPHVGGRGLSRGGEGAGVQQQEG
mmetsp:Transcript_3956/g.17496  ORF Transcript_3956/g.17496 Transcript_3956/m.17496 type:complete len:223 (+) Transcript_3956:2833-3501(+)